MSVTIFSAFRSTVTAFTERLLSSTDRWLVDPVTGAITGVQTPTATGANARFVPVDITQAQVTSPPPLMVADLDAVFRLNVAPYTRYYSDGTELQAYGAESGETIIPAGFSELFYSPLTITPPQVLVVQGTLTIRTLAA